MHMQLGHDFGIELDDECGLAALDHGAHDHIGDHDVALNLRKAACGLGL